MAAPELVGATGSSWFLVTDSDTIGNNVAYTVKAPGGSDTALADNNSSSDFGTICFYPLDDFSDRNQRGTIKNSTAPVAGTFYGVLHDFDSPVDFSSTNKRQFCIFLHLRTATGVPNLSSASGIRITFYSGTAGVYTNYKSFIVAGANSFNPATEYFARLQSGDPVDWSPHFIDPNASGFHTSGGSFDPSTIHAFSIECNYTSTSSTVFYCHAIATDLPTLIEGDSTSKADFSYYPSEILNRRGDIFYRSSVTSIGYMPVAGTSGFLFGHALQIGKIGSNVYFEQEDFFIEWHPAASVAALNKSCIAADGQLGMNVVLGATSTLILRRGTFYSDQSLSFIWSADAASTRSLTNLRFVNFSHSFLADPRFTPNSATFINCAELNLGGGTLTDSLIQESVGTSGVLLDNANLVGCTIRDSANAGARISSAGDYSSNTATLRDNGTYDVYIDATVTDGQSIDISGFEFLGSTPTNIYWAGTTGQINVTVSQAGLSTDSAGGTITLAEPAIAIEVNGIPQVTGAVLAVQDLSDDSITYPTITTGTATVPTDPSGSYKLMCDAPGYLRQSVTLDGNVPSYTFNLPDYRALYESGTAHMDEIGFDYGTFEVLVGDGSATYTFADVFRTLEDYLSTENGVLFDYPPLPVVVDLGGGKVRNYLFFPYDTQLDQINPVVIRPDPTNTADPTLTDFVIVLEGATAPLFDIFDFTLASGRTIRFQTEAVAATVSVSGDGALTTDQANQLTALYNTTTAGTGETVFSVDALQNAPSGGGGTADWTTDEKSQIRYRLGIDGTEATPATNTPELGIVQANVLSVDGETAIANNSVNFDQLAIITDGVPTSNTAISSTVTAGTVLTGTVASTQADDGTYYSLNPTASGLDVYLEFQIGSNFPNGLTFNGKYTAQANRFCQVYAYDWVVGGWELISSLETRLNHSTADINRSYPLLSKHRNGVGDTGEVRIRFSSADTNTGYRLDIDQILLQSVSAAVTAAEIAEATRQRTIENSYRQDYGISINTVDGVAGAVIGENGIPQNPSSNIADAYTLSIQPRISTNTFYVDAGSSLTLDRTYENYNFVGDPSLWTLNLGGQVLTGTAISFARVSGTGYSSGNRIRFRDCIVFDVTVGNSIYDDTVIVGTITCLDGSEQSLRDCFGRENSTINFANPTTTTRVEVLDYQGYLSIRNMNSNCRLILIGSGVINLDSTVTGGIIEKAGDWHYEGTGYSFDDEVNATVDEIIEALNKHGYTSPRAGYIDKLNVAGTLVQTTNLPGNFASLGIDADGVLSTLPAPSENWLNGDAIATSAITKIQANLATAKNVGDAQIAIITQGNLAWTTATGFLTSGDIRAEIGMSAANLDTQLAAIGTDVDSALVDTMALIAQIDILLTRLSTARAGYLDKLNVTGVLAHSDAAGIYKADVAPLLTAIGQIPTNPLLATNYVPPDNVAIADIRGVVRADEYPGAEQWIKKEAGTDNVLFTKNISRDEDGKVISLTEAP